MNEFQQRRQRLLDQLPDNTLVLVASGDEQIRNRDVDYPFRAHSDFIYLTGFKEPEAVLVLVKKEANNSYLFLRPKDKDKEIWEGRRLGVEKAVEVLQVDKAFQNDELDETVSELIENVDSVYFTFSQLADWAPHLDGWIQQQKAKSRKGVLAPVHLGDLDQVLHEMRLIKSEEEIERMRVAARISVEGHLAAMRSAMTAEFEYQVQAALEQRFKELGSPRVAFNSIVAGGENACILHYTENDQPLNSETLVLVDAGAESEGYAGDITQTFPVSGQFTQAQKVLYQCCLRAQHAAINVIRPGVGYDEMHKAASREITEGLLALGILTGEVETLIKEEAYKSFFMHGTGHWLGLDVHDVGQYKRQGDWRELEAGMVITVEPGIYISAEVGRELNVDEQYWNIGIRIEDDVLVTENGFEVLTQGLPRTPEEIETFMAE